MEKKMRQGKSISESVIGCAFEVSSTLGAGFLEAVYESALYCELEAKGIAFERQKPLVVRYRGKVVGKYVADIVVEDRLLVELKAVARLSGEHQAQVMNYLRAANLNVGLLLNFGSPRLGISRIVWNYDETMNL